MKTIRYFLLIILIYGLLVWGGRNTVVASTAFLVQMVSVFCILIKNTERQRFFK